MFVAHHFDTHSTTNHPTSPSSDPFPCSLSPDGSVLDGLGFAHPSQSRQLAWPNRVHLRCGLGVSHSVAPDHASRHRPYSVLLVLSRFNNAGLSPAVMCAPWRTRGVACNSREFVEAGRSSFTGLRALRATPLQRFKSFHHQFLGSQQPFKS